MLLEWWCFFQTRSIFGQNQTAVRKSNLEWFFLKIMQVVTHAAQNGVDVLTILLRTVLEWNWLYNTHQVLERLTDLRNCSITNSTSLIPACPNATFSFKAWIASSGVLINEQWTCHKSASQQVSQVNLTSSVHRSLVSGCPRCSLNHLIRSLTEKWGIGRKGRQSRHKWPTINEHCASALIRLNMTFLANGLTCVTHPGSMACTLILYQISYFIKQLSSFYSLMDLKKCWHALVMFVLWWLNCRG